MAKISGINIDDTLYDLKDKELWLGTRAEHTAAEQAGTLPSDAIIGIKDESGSGGGGGGGGAAIDDNVISTAKTWSSSKINTVTTTEMTGATSSSDGVAGLVPEPKSADAQKALFGDGQYHTIYTAASGSTIIVQTTETSLYGRTVTLTLGSSTQTATMSNSGEAVFTDISYYGTAIVSADNGTGNTAIGSVDLTYFGNYVVGIGFDYSTIIWESSNVKLAGKPLGVYVGNRQVGTVTLTLAAGTSVVQAVMYVKNVAEYKIDTMTSAGRARGTAVVTALHQTYTANVDTGEIYAFKIAKGNSDPATCVTAYESAYGCDNLGYTPAHMNFTDDEFDYGSWTTQEFFFPKPCMLAYDGTVDYYLDPDDYTKKEDGTASDVTSLAYSGNVMIEFPTIYFKRWEDSNYYYCVISDKQLDSDFHAYAHHDVNGDVLEHIYIAAYNGAYDGTRLRSISGIAYHNQNQLTINKIMSNTTRAQEIGFAQANNDANEQGEGWYIIHKAEWDMVNDLLILIGMNTNVQNTFGHGNNNSSQSLSNTGIITTGTCDGSGQFWGDDDNVHSIKVFGMENTWWGNMWTSLSGWCNVNGTQKVKMTYGQEDGSATDGYNTDGTNYISIPNSTPSGSTGGYISGYIKGENGLIPKTLSGSASTYLCDSFFFNNKSNCYALFGGSSGDGLSCGAFCSHTEVPPDGAYYHVGAVLVYKGIAS